MTTLREITEKELRAIPENKRIVTRPVSVTIGSNRESDISRACPIDHATDYLVTGRSERSFSMLLGQKVYDDNFREDFDRISAGYPFRDGMKTHGCGCDEELKVVYVARLEERAAEKAGGRDSRSYFAASFSI